MNYLTESKLGIFLSEIIFPGYEFVYDKIVPGSNILNRPDYRNDVLKLIVEFDGYQHYNSCSYILTDAKKDIRYKEMGYKIVRIPYFIQLSTEIIKLLFDIDVNFQQIYPHGFIDPKAMLPCDYCELGLLNFQVDLDRFKIVRIDITHSLEEKIKEKNNINLVLPPSLSVKSLNNL